MTFADKTTKAASQKALPLQPPLPHVWKSGLCNRLEPSAGKRTSCLYKESNLVRCLGGKGSGPHKVFAGKKGGKAGDRKGPRGVEFATVPFCNWQTVPDEERPRISRSTLIVRGQLCERWKYRESYRVRFVSFFKDIFPKCLLARFPRACPFCHRVVRALFNSFESFGCDGRFGKLVENFGSRFESRERSRGEGDILSSRFSNWELLKREKGGIKYIGIDRRGYLLLPRSYSKFRSWENFSKNLCTIYVRYGIFEFFIVWKDLSRCIKAALKSPYRDEWRFN